MPYKWNAITGQLDYFQDTATTDDAKRLVDTKTCAENISALRLVNATDDTSIELADPSAYTTGIVLGVALQAGLLGEDIEVLLFGKLEDVSFTFTLNEPLFLTANGVITSTPPTTGFSVNIGHSLGSGAIFVNIKEPIEL